MTSLLNVNHILQTGGMVALLAIIFAESGLLVGFFLPGDTLLIPAGILASQHKFASIYILVPSVAIAAIIGYQVAYAFGRRAGPKVFKRKDGLLFRQDYIPRTQNFVNHHGNKAMILGRFVAVVRTFVPIMAGVGEMPRKQFTFYNIVGGTLWATSLLLSSYWVGQKVDHVDRFIVPIVVIGVVLTVGGEVLFLVRSSSSRKQFAKALREEFAYFFKR